MKNNADATGDLDNVESSSVIKERVDSSISQVEEISELVQEDLIDKDKQGHEEMNGADYMDGGINDRQQNDTMSKEGSVEKDFTKEGMNTSYANSLTKNLNGKGNQLFSIPTGVNCKGEEVVLFDEEFVKERSEKWNLIVCGYFVGCRMSVNELKYHTRRMWGSPWIVNGKPLIAQKWDPEVIIKKESPSLILVWVRLFNVPLEAWSIKGISAISSRLGKPVMMDHMNYLISWQRLELQNKRLGMQSFLVEIDAGKNYVDKVEINYVDDKKNVKMGKSGVFMETRQMQSLNNVTQSKYVVKPKVPNPTEVSTSKINNSDPKSNGSKNPRKSWKISKENVEELKRSANKWDYDMINYFKYSWEAMEKNENELSDDEDWWDPSFDGMWMKGLGVPMYSIKPLLIVIQGRLRNFNVILKPEEQSNGPSGLRKLTNESREDLLIPWRNEDYSSGDYGKCREFHQSLLENSSFRFSNHVADKKDFLDIVRGVWMKEVKGCNMYKVVQKLKMLKGPLRKLSWKDGNIFEKVQEIKKTLEDVQCKLDADPFNNGSRVEDGQVSQQFVDHFNMFLGQSSNVTPLNDLEDYVQARLSDAEASAMITMVTDDEIKEAIFDIDSTKAASA
ncbi:RNA-directed DNA polymerase, eukaryota, reverse transcriptase zinc-binding domain protein [Tanacetum coccineum]